MFNLKHSFGDEFGYFGVGSYTGQVKWFMGKVAVPEGKGIWTAFGDVQGNCSYIGDWHDGKRHGLGIMTR